MIPYDLLFNFFVFAFLPPPPPFPLWIPSVCPTNDAQFLHLFGSYLIQPKLFSSNAVIVIIMIYLTTTAVVVMVVVLGVRNDIESGSGRDRISQDRFK